MDGLRAFATSRAGFYLGFSTANAVPSPGLGASRAKTRVRAVTATQRPPDPKPQRFAAVTACFPVRRTCRAARKHAQRRVRHLLRAPQAARLQQQCEARQQHTVAHACAAARPWRALPRRPACAPRRLASGYVARRRGRSQPHASGAGSSCSAARRVNAPAPRPQGAYRRRGKGPTATTINARQLGAGAAPQAAPAWQCACAAQRWRLSGQFLRACLVPPGVGVLETQARAPRGPMGRARTRADVFCKRGCGHRHKRKRREGVALFHETKA
jgi:hypothetical protein